MPVLSTWVLLSSSQEDTRPTPQFVSTTRLAGKRIFPHYSTLDGAMAAPTSTIMREARWVVLTFFLSPTESETQESSVIYFDI